MRCNGKRPFHIPTPPRQSLYPFQEEGVRFALDHKRCLIADSMGLGKTIQAIALCNIMADELRQILIICPASLKLNWEREWRQWSTRKGDQVCVVNGNGWPVGANVVIVNYDLLKKYSAELHARFWDLLACDESHYLKNSKSQRTKEVIGQWQKDDFGIWTQPVKPIQAGRTLFLSGTPLLNRPVELWTTCKALDPEGLGAMGRRAFEERYCDASEDFYGWNNTGASNLGELSRKVKGFSIRRTKEQVLAQLPPKRLQVIVLDTPRELREKLEQEKAEYDKAMLTGGYVSFESMSKVRKQVALAKAKYVIEHLEDLLESESKVVCMAHHHEVIDRIADAFSGTSVVMDGRASLRERQTAIDCFQSDSSCKLLIGGIKVAGTGITLTAASVIVFAELDWTPGVLSQAEDRLHRIGQTRRVLVQHIVLDNSLDAHLVRLLVKKQRIINEVASGVCAHAS